LCGVTWKRGGRRTERVDPVTNSREEMIREDGRKFVEKERRWAKSAETKNCARHKLDGMVGQNRQLKGRCANRPPPSENYNQIQRRDRVGALTAKKEVLPENDQTGSVVQNYTTR